MLASRVIIVPLLTDNYCYLIRRGSTVVCIDPGEALPVANTLKELNWPLHYILNTHHHADHIDGNTDLRDEFNAKITTSEALSDRIPHISDIVQIGMSVLPGTDFEVDTLDTAGHTEDHVSFKIDDNLFCGDTVFSLGCGRLFEGTAANMLSSIERIMALPSNTMLYPGHEYTLSNAKFALSVDPMNRDLLHRVEEVVNLRKEYKPTIPVSLETEMKTNPFMRCHFRTIKRAMKMKDDDPTVDVFAKLRKAKDKF